MEISRSGNRLAVCTPYSDTHRLLQIFSNIGGGAPGANNPVEFHLAALQSVRQRDLWHPDVLLAYSTDEAAPPCLNGGDIGGNHGCECVVEVTAPAHGKDCTDAGSLWRDEAGLRWTLLGVPDGDTLRLISENTGECEARWRFAERITGRLTCEGYAGHEAPILPGSMRGGIPLEPAIRPVECRVYTVTNGVRRPMEGGTECDECEIVEEYEIINPATVGRTLRKNRPQGGYTSAPELNVGDCALRHRQRIHIAPDGTVLCEMEYDAAGGVCWDSELGIMHQVKCDTEGAGVWRCIPAVRPMEEKGRVWDFSVPVNTSEEPFPHNLRITREFWADPGNPPEHQLDFIRRRGGKHFEDAGCIAAFASGFLPIGDGAPAVRARNRTAGIIPGSRKTYPTLFDEGRAQEPVRRIRAVAYRKYFLPESRTHAVYTVPWQGKTYVWTDFWADGKAEIPLEGRRCTPIASHGLTHTVQDGVLTAAGSRGTAAFCLE